ncbi:ecto-ADP-ribosyltransferase 4-like [Acanthopagrus schlegelii]
MPLGRGAGECLCCVVVPENPVSLNYMTTLHRQFPSKDYGAAVGSTWQAKDMKFCKGPVYALKSVRNRASICALLVVTFLLYHDPFLLLWWPQTPAEKPKTGGVNLDMATDSIDDMYDGCRSETASVIDVFGVYEWHVNRNFSYAWAAVERLAKKPAHKSLTEEHAIALYMYTKIRNIQHDFNKAVKTGKHKYSTYEFKFHYFYFYLTDAVQVLRHNQTTCRTTYHRTREQFDHSVVDTNVRFGAFTWVALSKQSFESNGNVSCFEIHSCFGADITYYSASDQRGQVLIPPYEVFTVTDVLTNDLWCNVVYKLQSTKIPRRDLNCNLNLGQNSFTTFSTQNTQIQAGSVGMVLVWLMLLAVISLVLVHRKQRCFVAAVLGSLLVLLIVLLVLKVSH